MRRYTFFILIAFILSVFSVSPLHAKRIALVIGNNTYKHLGKDNQLRLAKNDAKVVGKTLAELGFKVAEGYDLSRQEMNRKVSDLANIIEAGDEIVFFYAGHGVGIDGQNYLVPVDMPNSRTGDVNFFKSEAIRVRNIINTFKTRGARVTILILDACRNNPFDLRYKDKTGREIKVVNGLAHEREPGKGTMVIFSAGAGQVALDSIESDNDNQNSIFTRTMVPLMKKKGLEIKAMVNLVREKVHDLAVEANHNQVPASYNEIIRSYYLAGSTGEAFIAGSEEAKKKFTALKKRIKELETKFRQIQSLAKAVPAGTIIQAPVKQSRSVSSTSVDGAKLKPGDKFRDCELCPEMLVIPPGEFMMGSKQHKDAVPVHKVTIARKFAAGRFKITFNEWYACVADGGCGGYRPQFKLTTTITDPYNDSERIGYSSYIGGKGNEPVINVSWLDAKSYVKWLSEKTGRRYRLLSEAEWEYLTQIRTDHEDYVAKYNKAGFDQCEADSDRCSIAIAYRKLKKFDTQQKFLRVKVKISYDKYQLKGIPEWVEDCYHNNYQKASSAALALKTGDCSRRVVRGNKGEERINSDTYRKPVKKTKIRYKKHGNGAVKAVYGDIASLTNILTKRSSSGHISNNAKKFDISFRVARDL